MNRSVGRTDVGLVRKNNEDAYAIDDAAGYCALADGMGGAAAGEIASRIFVDTVRGIFPGREPSPPGECSTLVQRAFVIANQRMLDHVRDNPSHRGMGCTAELLVYADDGFVIGHMGDSRTYRLRNGVLKQLTRDHSLVQEQIEKGIITPREARTSPHRNIILCALGTSENPALDIIRGKTFVGDLFLLCSDGLTDMIEDDRILRILTSSQDLAGTADDLIAAAKQAGGKDNVTVVLSRVEAG
ncbi:MAG TPA: Stp1/IreP family PP2C-type Ser/Thr phosphatase [Deltaproteobacteria bacterium]|jgi:protein phosphatase|nr:Stp1/IreP family PP2C-type Ser/Thr phosphatase [Deltaproteobacteria bacterium]